MAAFISGLKTQAMAMLPQLVQNAEPQMEAQLRQTLRTIKATKPAESELFLTNWRKLDKAVQEELSVQDPSLAMGGKKKRKTRKHKKRT